VLRDTEKSDSYTDLFAAGTKTKNAKTLPPQLTKPESNLRGLGKKATIDAAGEAEKLRLEAERESLVYELQRLDEEKVKEITLNLHHSVLLLKQCFCNCNLVLRTSLSPSIS
jgi:hypothetical protein